MRAHLQAEKASLAYLGGALVKPCKVDIILHGGECFTAAGIEFSVLHTPGHTKGGVCYVIEKERVIFFRRHAFPSQRGKNRS